MSAQGSESIGERLRRLRVERGLSQRELSTQGVSYAYISRIEAGARRPSVKALRMVAPKLGVSATYLETGSEIDSNTAREVRMADLELRLRLEPAADDEQELRDILVEAIDQGDLLCAARAQIALGWQAHRAGREQEAIEMLERALEVDHVTPLTRPDAYVLLARLLVMVGRAADAVALLEKIAAETRQRAPHDTAAQVRWATYLAAALTDLGELGAAHKVLDDALANAGENPERMTGVRIYWSLGRLAMNENKPILALTQLRRALALLEAGEDTSTLARAHLALAWAMIDAGHADDAGRELELADTLLGGDRLLEDDVMLNAYRARRASKLGDHDAARRLARRALELAGTTLAAERGIALLCLAAAAEARRDVDAATAYRTALQHIESFGPTRLRDEAQEGLDRLLGSA